MTGTGTDADFNHIHQPFMEEIY